MDLQDDSSSAPRIRITPAELPSSSTNDPGGTPPLVDNERSYWEDGVAREVVPNLQATSDGPICSTGGALSRVEDASDQVDFADFAAVTDNRHRPNDGVVREDGAVPTYSTQAERACLDETCEEHADNGFFDASWSTDKPDPHEKNHDSILGSTGEACGGSVSCNEQTMPEPSFYPSAGANSSKTPCSGQDVVETSHDVSERSTTTQNIVTEKQSIDPVSFTFDSGPANTPSTNDSTAMEDSAPPLQSTDDSTRGAKAENCSPNSSQCAFFDLGSEDKPKKVDDDFFADFSSSQVLKDKAMLDTAIVKGDSCHTSNLDESATIANEELEHSIPYHTMGPVSANITTEELQHNIPNTMDLPSEFADFSSLEAKSMNKESSGPDQHTELEENFSTTTLDNGVAAVLPEQTDVAQGNARMDSTELSSYQCADSVHKEEAAEVMGKGGPLSNDFGDFSAASMCAIPEPSSSGNCPVDDDDFADFSGAPLQTAATSHGSINNSRENFDSPSKPDVVEGIDDPSEPIPDERDGQLEDFSCSPLQAPKLVATSEGQFDDDFEYFSKAKQVSENDDAADGFTDPSCSPPQFAKPGNSDEFEYFTCSLQQAAPKPVTPSEGMFDADFEDFSKAKQVSEKEDEVDGFTGSSHSPPQIVTPGTADEFGDFSFSPEQAATTSEGRFDADFEDSSKAKEVSEKDDTVDGFTDSSRSPPQIVTPGDADEFGDFSFSPQQAATTREGQFGADFEDFSKAKQVSEKDDTVDGFTDSSCSPPQIVTPGDADEFGDFSFSPQQAATTSGGQFDADFEDFSTAKQVSEKEDEVDGFTDSSRSPPQIVPPENADEFGDFSFSPQQAATTSEGQCDADFEDFSKAKQVSEKDDGVDGYTGLPRSLPKIVTPGNADNKGSMDDEFEDFSSAPNQVAAEDEFEEFTTAPTQVVSSEASPVAGKGEMPFEDDEFDDFSKAAEPVPQGTAAVASGDKHGQTTGFEDEGDEDDWGFTSATEPPAASHVQTREILVDKVKKIMAEWCTTLNEVESSTRKFEIAGQVENESSEDPNNAEVADWDSWIAHDAGIPVEARTILQTGISDGHVPIIPFSYFGSMSKGADISDSKSSKVCDVFFSTLGKHMQLPAARGPLADVTRERQPDGAMTTALPNITEGDGDSACSRSPQSVLTTEGSGSPATVSGSLADAPLVGDADWGLFESSTQPVTQDVSTPDPMISNITSVGGGDLLTQTLSNIGMQASSIPLSKPAPTPVNAQLLSGAGQRHATTQGRMPEKVKSFLQNLPDLSHMLSPVIVS